MLLRVPYLPWLALLVVAQLLDLVSFVVMVTIHGLAAEANPIAAWLAGELGLGAAGLAKLGVICLALLVIIDAAARRPMLSRLVLATGIGAGSIGFASNVATIAFG